MVNEAEIIDLIRTRVGPFQKKRDEYIFDTCFFCGNPKRNFEVNIHKGVFHCWVCSTGGSLAYLLRSLNLQYNGKLPETARHHVVAATQAQERLVIPPVVPIASSPRRDKIIEYLRRRNINEADIERYGISWWEEEGRVFFPIKNAIGNIIFWTARAIFEGSYRKYIHADMKKKDMLFMLPGNNPDRLLVVEGIFDAIRANKEGYTVVFLLGSNIPEVLVEYARIHGSFVDLCLDADVAVKQQRYEDMLAQKLGPGRVQARYLQGKDVAAGGVRGETGLAGFVKSRLKIGER